MKAVIDFIKNSQIQYFATVGLDGKPKVRPFQLMLADKGKLYFCTSNQKSVYQEIQKQPYVELCASGENLSWLRLRGKVVFTQDLTIKDRDILSCQGESHRAILVFNGKTPGFDRLIGITWSY